jgi:3-dehydroquinate synthase
LIVKHASGSYAIEFCSLAHALASQPGVIVTDKNVSAAWGAVFAERDQIVLPPGEETKSLDAYGRLVRDLAKQGTRRSDSLIALGGGVVGDLAGFAAASYMRGVSLVQIPTTLLAMVDSSVGGKVGIDLPEGKNLVGAFWPPVAVKIPLETLSTLPDRQFRNGKAEIWKYGFTLELGICDRLAKKPLMPDSPDLEDVIRRCLTLKAGVVQEDEHDRTGRRAVLNFGHTIGHAIERVTGYTGLLHGEAISIGMVAEAKLGEALGLTRSGTAEQIRSWLEADGLPVTFPGLGNASIIAAMRVDKKAESPGLAFSLVTELGRCKLVPGLAEDEVAAILRTL